MVTCFATLGHTAKLVLVPLRRAPAIKTLHVFYGTPQQDDGKAALATVRSTCEGLGVKLVEHPIFDAFDYGNFVHAFSRALIALPKRGRVIFNGSGGTRVMTMAATIFCFTHDVELHYYDEYDTPNGKVIPLQAFRNLDRLGTTSRTILRILQKQGPSDMTSLASDMGLAASTVTGHVQTLQEYGTVRVGKSGKRRVVSILPDLAQIDLGVN